MKKAALFLVALLPLFGQTNVQKGPGNLISNGNVVVGNATSITTAGSGIIAATAIPGLTVATTAPLTGGGPLSGNLTLAIPAATGSVNGYLTSGDWATFNSKQAAGNYITAPWPGNVSLTTLGTITTGNWSASVIDGAHGGTGVANTDKTLTLSGNVTYTGPYTTTWAQTGNATLTLPATSDTLVGRATTDTLGNKSISGATNTLSAIPGSVLNAFSVPNAALANASITIAGNLTPLGNAITLDAIDNAIAANGLIVRTGANTRAARSITQGAGVTVTNPDGVAGNITVAANVTTVASRTGAVTLAQADIAGLTTASAPTFAGLTSTGHNVFEGVTSTGATGTGNLVYSIAPTFTGIVRHSGSTVLWQDVPNSNFVVGSSNEPNTVLPLTAGPESGQYNTAVGIFALNSVTTGKINVALGGMALMATTTGGYNTAAGLESLYANTSGSNNTSVGQRSMYANTTGAKNVASGNESLYNNTTGGFNTAIGGYSLHGSVTNSFNTAVGEEALYSSTGNENTAIGYFASEANVAGINNTSVGSQAAGNVTVGSNNISVGQKSGYSKAGGNYTVMVGAGDVLVGTQRVIDSSVIIGGSNNTQINNSGGTALTNIIAINGVATASNQTIIGNSGTQAATIFGKLTPVQILATDSAPPASGTTVAGGLRVYGAGGVAVDIGNQGTSPFPTWIQVSDVANQATHYPLWLNPSGGNVTIGNTASSTTVVGNLTVSGTGTSSTSGSWTVAKALATTPSALTYASPTSVDVTLASMFTVTTVNATGSVTFNATAGGTAGQDLVIFITNDATSAKTITFGTNFTANGTLTPSGVNKVATITFKSNGTSFVELARTVLP